MGNDSTTTQLFLANQTFKRDAADADAAQHSSRRIRHNATIMTFQLVSCLAFDERGHLPSLSRREEQIASRRGIIRTSLFDSFQII